MFSRPLLSSLLDRAGCLLSRLRGRPPEPPSFEGLLDELFASWPLEPGECPGRARTPRAEEAA